MNRAIAEPAAGRSDLLFEQLPLALAGQAAALAALMLLLPELAGQPLRLLAPGLLGLVRLLAARRAARSAGLQAERERMRLWALPALAGAAVWGVLLALSMPEVDEVRRMALVMLAAALALGSPAAPSGVAWLQAALTGLPVAAMALKLASDRPLQALPMLALLLAGALVGQHHRHSFSRLMRLRRHAALLTAQIAAEKDAADAARAAAEAATQARTRFFAGASHDLRQPLHALVLFTESLRQRNRDPALDDSIDSIAGAVDALEHLFDRLLDLSSLEAGAVRVDERPFHLRELYARLKLHFEPQAFDKGLSLTFRGGRHAARADPVLVERILRNLVSNAIRCTEDGGVLVSCRRRGDRLLLQVWDSGCGIEAAVLPRIFDEFYQGRPAGECEGAPARRGRGLGLAIARRLAGLMGLALAVRSRPGHGTVFALELAPASDAEVEAARRLPSPSWSSPTLQGRHVVRITGTADPAADEAAALLRAWGAQVSAFSGTDGLAEWAAVQPQVPALLIVDRRLPGAAATPGAGQDGLEPVRMLRQVFGRPVPAVLLAGEGEPAGEPAEPDVHLLSRPVAPNRLRAMVGSKLGPRAPAAFPAATVQSRTPT